MQCENSGSSTSSVAPWAVERLLATLHECVDEVFGTMVGRVAVLSQVDEEDGPVEDEPSAEEDFEAVVEFKGLLDGAIVVRCSQAVGADIAKGFLMLGEEDPLEVGEIRDALGECANLISGSLKSKALDPQGSFVLGLPSLDGKADALPYQHHGTLNYRISQGGAAVELWLDGTLRSAG